MTNTKQLIDAECGHGQIFYVAARNYPTLCLGCAEEKALKVLHEYQMARLEPAMILRYED